MSSRVALQPGGTLSKLCDLSRPPASLYRPYRTRAASIARSVDNRLVSGLRNTVGDNPEVLRIPIATSLSLPHNLPIAISLEEHWVCVQ